MTGCSRGVEVVSNVHETLEIEVNAETLAEIRRIAREENCDVDALVDEALVDLIEKREHSGVLSASQTETAREVMARRRKTLRDLSK